MKISRLKCNEKLAQYVIKFRNSVVKKSEHQVEPTWETQSLSEDIMAQGKLKPKAKLPDGAKQKSEKNKVHGLKKGGK